MQVRHIFPLTKRHPTVTNLFISVVAYAIQNQTFCSCEGLRVESYGTGSQVRYVPIFLQVGNQF